jgi:hypothetical protein
MGGVPEMAREIAMLREEAARSSAVNVEAVRVLGAQQQEIARLTAELEAVKAERDFLAKSLIMPAELVDRAERAEAERGALAEALKPFSDWAMGEFDLLPDDTPITQGSRFARRQITAGDFKRARAALARLAP